MNIQESLNKAIQSLPERPVYQILITKLLQNMWIADFDDRKYIIINHILWIRLEHELDQFMTRTSASIIPEGLTATYCGIPVYENEDLVKEIVSKIF